MAKKFDGVVEAVHYNPDGQIALVRAYVRRGVTFSDRVLINRETLVEQLKAGKKFVAGQRKEFLGSTFEVGKPIKVLNKNGGAVVTTREGVPQRDEIEETPVF